MAEDVLIPTPELVKHEPEAFARMDQLHPPVLLEARAGEAGQALARSLIFEHWPDLGPDGLDPARRLYNQYFWFKRFAMLWQESNGEDLGVLQQLLKILENADFELDFGLLEILDQRAVEGVLP